MRKRKIRTSETPFSLLLGAKKETDGAASGGCERHYFFSPSIKFIALYPIGSGHLSILTLTVDLISFRFPRDRGLCTGDPHSGYNSLLFHVTTIVLQL
jgi:hypothetical protein